MCVCVKEIHRDREKRRRGFLMTGGIAEMSGVQVQLCRKFYLSDIIRFEGLAYVLPGSACDTDEAQGCRGWVKSQVFTIIKE